jgi:hypothetical protein
MWEIVDFKSGRPSKNPATRVQLEAYAVAADEVRFAPVRPDRLQVTFAYLGGGLTEVSESVDSDWLVAARVSLGHVISSIRDQAWDPDPSTACRSCDFRRFCGPGRDWLASNR